MKYVALIAVLALAAACYSASEVSYSNPQTTANQWLIEFKTDEAKVQLTIATAMSRSMSLFGSSIRASTRVTSSG